MSRILLIAGCAVLAGCGVVQARASGVVRGRSDGVVQARPLVESTRAFDQRVARAFALRQLSAVRLPPGARSVAADPAVGGVLASPQSRPGVGRLIDQHRFWRVTGTPAALIGWLRRHAPAGTRLSSWGSGADRGVTFVWTRGYSFRILPAAVYEAELDFAIAVANGGGTAVRVDSFAAGLVPRPAWERVPAAVTSVAITVRPFDGGRVYPVATVSAPAEVERLVRAFNGFRIVQPGTAFSCPAFPGAAPLLRFRFLSAGGARLADAAESGCVGLRFSVARRTGPALWPDVDLTQLLWAAHLLPVCSALSVTAGPVTPTPAPVEFSLPFEIRDTGGGACGLRGYPQVRLLNVPGPSLVPRVTRIPAGHPVTPPVVLLDPSWPATTSIDWPAQPTCKALPFSRVQLRLPEVATPFMVRLRHPIAPCGGRITVAPI
jgi:hypothetical protein